MAIAKQHKFFQSFLINQASAKVAAAPQSARRQSRTGKQLR